MSQHLELILLGQFAWIEWAASTILPQLYMADHAHCEISFRGLYIYWRN